MKDLKAQADELMDCIVFHSMNIRNIGKPEDPRWYCYRGRKKALKWKLYKTFTEYERTLNYLITLHVKLHIAIKEKEMESSK